VPPCPEAAGAGLRALRGRDAGLHGVTGEFELRTDVARADTLAMNLVPRPWEYDVMVGERHGCQPAREAGERLRRAVEDAFRDGEPVIRERGGKAGTAEVTAAVREALIDGRAAAGGHRSIA